MINKIKKLFQKERKVSLIVTAYNIESYLVECLDSLVAQTYKNLEIIIINDGSKDKTSNIIKDFESRDKRIKSIHLPYNTVGGCAIASNLGIDKSSGEYLMFVDGDDFLASKDSIRVLVKNIEESNSDWVMGQYTELNDKTGKEQASVFKKRDKKAADFCEENKHLNLNCYPELAVTSQIPGNKLFRLKFLRKHGIRFWEGDFFFEDNPFFWQIITLSNHIKIIKDVVTIHRKLIPTQTTSVFKNEAKSQLKPSYIIRQYEHINLKLKNSDYIKSFKTYLKQRPLNWLIDQTSCSDKIKDKFYRKIRDLFPEKFNYKKKLSIVIPCFNIQKHQNNLQQICNGLFNSTELILINDNSTDDSQKILDKINKDNVYLITPHKKLFAGGCRNLGMCLTEGEYTVFLDADDPVDIKQIQSLTSELDANNYDLLFYKYKNMSNFQQKLYNKEEIHKTINYPWNRIISSKLMAQKSIYFGPTKIHNDIQYHWSSIYHAKNIGFSDASPIEHITHDTGLTESKDRKEVCDALFFLLLECRKFSEKFKHDAEIFAEDLINWTETKTNKDEFLPIKERFEEIKNWISKNEDT